jgi:rSAM/selenodomain-associated transferase 1
MQKNSLDALIVFQKNPKLGKVKTRLAATVGNHRALEIYEFLIEKTFSQINKTRREIDVFVYYSDFLPDVQEYESSHSLCGFVQKGTDLGDRMKNAFSDIFALGYQKILILGTDCPTIQSEIIEEAFRGLEKVQVVVGPASDGGYYLLGMNRLIEDLFVDIPWSTPEVLSISSQSLLGEKIPFLLLPELSDIDTEEDWLNYINLIPKEYD